MEWISCLCIHMPRVWFLIFVYRLEEFPNEKRMDRRTEIRINWLAIWTVHVCAIHCINFQCYPPSVLLFLFFHLSMIISSILILLSSDLLTSSLPINNKKLSLRLSFQQKNYYSIKVAQFFLHKANYVSPLTFWPCESRITKWIWNL